jgi:hypothetical protein
MNDTLELKGKFIERKKDGKVGAAHLPSGQHVTAEHLYELANEIQKIILFWKDNNNYISLDLISVYYIKVVAKSNRVNIGLLSKGSTHGNDTIRGAKFTNEANPKHIITHCVEEAILNETYDRLNGAAKIISEYFGGTINNKHIDKINNGKINVSGMSKSMFSNVVVDAYYVDKFDIEKNPEITGDQAIVTLFETGDDVDKLLLKIGIDPARVEKYSNNTLLLYKNQYKLLKEKVPYLVTMSVDDITKIPPHSETNVLKSDLILDIPKPNGEPTIGVIDTPYSRNTYFDEWVDDRVMVNDDITITPEDRIHGTEVSSIIVDGPSFNPSLQDDCGRFQVRHFGVATGGHFSSFRVIMKIKKIVEENPDIKVWNLSLGSIKETSNNFISPEASLLDQIQYENDVIFIIAGTNDIEKTGSKRIGAPADSINSLVVNSVKSNNESASYTRSGPVLRFFRKPDVSYYGGDDGDPLVLCGPDGEHRSSGTSFAAPWITRKMAYLIYKLNLSKEVAKALIIDSAAGWSVDNKQQFKKGFGIVPIKIEDVVNSSDDEIRFVLRGVSTKYDTYNYEIPVPENLQKYPYIARAVLCYFPKCERNQGVDYTDTELDLHFGRVKKDGTLLCIDDNRQGTDDKSFALMEDAAREFFRKWDNVKRISEDNKKTKRSKLSFPSGMWGISLKTKERLNNRAGEGIKFGIVITLKEIDGINRIDTFIRMCYSNRWTVTPIRISERIEIFNKAQEDIEFE